ncbi:potassium-transporting ATPase subunit C [Candidatus Enterococcus leclercqii]|uniref:potassium-transporting ATPase subunit C n=1 Tax=Candidatus Enterococcus leclercqii TaxID=1857218 RepID=UPI00137A71F7|nr:potassium-transporting ATPase subunit C [Enterococcus sp. CU9D]KAF1290272.1 potassium transporter KtrB [Enterococcus sp. CU9D]
MKKILFSSLRFLLLSLLVFGGVYTLAVTGIGQLFFSEQANGSKITIDSQVVGSKLIGQSFQQDKYFSGRDTQVRQLSPVSIEQARLVQKRVINELEKNPTQKKVPVDLVTASASGVDPDISLEAARFQIDRIAKKRGLSKEIIQGLLDKYRQKDWFSNRYFVNVLQLNLALDKLRT